MKLARIIPLLLLTLALFAPRMTSAQTNDSIWIVSDCGSDPGFDWGFVNGHPQFVNQFLFIITPASVDAGFTFNASGEDGSDQKDWADTLTVTGDTINYFPLFTGVGDAPGVKDSAHFFLLGGPGGIQFPDSLFNQPITIEWESFAGGQLVSHGFITLIPTSYQGQCTFDSVSATATTIGCDPHFNFDVFDRNGPEANINQMQFQIEDISAGSIRASGIQAPSGWVLDSVTKSNAYFSTGCGGPDQINYRSNLSGFIVPLRANSDATDFTWEWFAYSCGALIDADTLSVPATPQPCSVNPSLDSVFIQNDGECNFQINTFNYHNGDNVDTVSPITSWTFTITTPGVTWSSATLPPQVTTGTWQYTGVGTNTLNFHEVAKFLIDPGNAQPGGTIWPFGGGINDPNPGENVNYVWSDTDVKTFESSGSGTIACSIGPPDTAWVETDAGCDYTLIVWNRHTHPTSSINAIAMTIPASAGTFTPSCFSSSNGWEPTVPGQSARFTNQLGASHYLKSGSLDTIHFCIDPAQVNSSWNLTWITIDSNNDNLFSNTINVPGCSPPLVCDSIRHGENASDCSDTITVLNLRQGGAEVDSVIVAPEAGWNIVKVDTPLFWQAAFEPDGSVNFTTTSHPITPGLPMAFTVWYNNPDANTFTVQVSTYSNGSVCSKTTSLQCPLSGVSPSDVPQSLAVSVVPNPMNQQADIMLTTGAFDRVQMTLVDVLGRTSKTVLNSTIAAGDHDYTLDVSQLPPETYYLRIVASGATLTKKLVIEH